MSQCIVCSDKGIETTAVFVFTVRMQGESMEAAKLLDKYEAPPSVKGAVCGECLATVSEMMFDHTETRRSPRHTKILKAFRALDVLPRTFDAPYPPEAN